MMHFDELFARIFLQNQLHEMLKLQHDALDLYLDFFVSIDIYGDIFVKGGVSC